LGRSTRLHENTEVLKIAFVLTFFIFCFSSVKAGINDFTQLIYVEEWLIERKVNLTINKIECRASIPSSATWFGARVRLGRNDELIKPIGIFLKPEKLLYSKLTKVREMLDDCRSGFLFIHEDF
tara:strand:+ start:52 stop:423 length:372 start_codon:yes stop_codon:yes gene_type:complete